MLLIENRGEFCKMDTILKIFFNTLNKFKNKKFSDVNKILFVRFDNKVGDTIIDSFFIRELKKFNSQIIIDIPIVINNKIILFLTDRYNYYETLQ